MTSTLNWIKSSYSSNDGPDCVEVAIPPAHTTVHVRDSKTPDTSHLTIAPAAWTDFLTYVGK
ncbi:DUF397 domain-containing protein [Streptomyces sp. NPDC052701]|uniref:DUF397 domain-containing protein n=1 Tax=Streptomyces sp. NPDC052701 TaxID=3155533 RepID=UPI00341316DA